MSDPKRVSPGEAREMERAGKGLLVCAYDDDEKFRKNRLEGAIALSDFVSMKSRLDKDAGIVFY